MNDPTAISDPRCLLCDGICPDCGGHVGRPAGRSDWILCSMCHATFAHAACGPFVIREAREQDAPVVTELILTAYEGYRGALVPPSGAHSETIESIAGKLTTSTGLVAEVNGTPVGVVLVVWRDEEAYFHRLAVLPEHRNKGVGSMLISEIERRAIARGLKTTTLGVRIALPRNVAYFESLGYAVYGRDSHPGFDVDTSLLMRKDLRTE